MKKVETGSRVKVNFDDGSIEDFQIVYPSDANILEGKVSNSSPIGKEILGKQQGKTISFLNSNQTRIKCKIVSVE